jgi:predicted nucleotidyltransferase
MAYTENRQVNEAIKGVRELLQELAKKHDIKSAYVFGSYAKGNPSVHSDIDIAVVLGSIRDGSPFDERFEIFHEIQEHNSLYEAICFLEDEFGREDETLIRHIKREGIKIL